MERMTDYSCLVADHPSTIKQCEEGLAGGPMCPSANDPSVVTSVPRDLSGNTKFARCEGCGEPIFDRFVMRLSESSWHEECLFCSQCHAPLQSSCYHREGKLFCRGDYERIFGVKCDRCGVVLSPHDLVMRTMAYIFHLGCFQCVMCGQPLQRGDQYVLRAGQLICRTDFEKELYMMQSFGGMDQGHRWMGDELAYDEVGGGRPRDGRRGPKRPRTILTAAQRRQFKASFEISPKPCRKVREALAKDTGLSVRVVQVWFQNQRAKMKKMQRRNKTDKDGKPIEGKMDKKDKGEGDRVGAGDGDSYCDSEASLDDGSCYDQLEEPSSPAVPDSLGAVHSLDLRNPHTHHDSQLREEPVGHHPPPHFLQPNPIDKLYLMQDSYFQP